MKIAQIHAWGNNDVVKIDTVDQPTIQDNEVLVAVHAAGVNPIDWKVREGYFADPATEHFPMPMGWDFSGTIVAVGKQATEYKIGDEVFGLIRFPQPAGCFAEFVAAPVNEIAHKPTNLTHEQAAGVPLVALTAWQALFATTQLKPQQVVLVHAGAGAVGQMAIQIAKWKGATVIATGSSASKDFLLSLGADFVIDYQSEKFETTVSNIDLVLDLVGGDITMRSLSTLKPGGCLICFTQPITPDVAKMATQKAIQAQFTIVTPNGQQLHQLAELLTAGILKTNIERTFPLAQIKDALTLQQSGRCHGKVILSIKS